MTLSGRGVQQLDKTSTNTPHSYHTYRDIIQSMVVVGVAKVKSERPGMQVLLLALGRVSPIFTNKVYQYSNTLNLLRTSQFTNKSLNLT